MERPPFLEGADPLSGEIEEAGSDVGAGGPRDYLVFDNGLADPRYSVGRLPLREEGVYCSFVAIAVVQDQVLVAVPQTVWHKKTKNRLIDSKALGKPSLVAVVACEEDSREEVSSLCSELRVWVGLLSMEMELRAEYLEPTDAETQVVFGGSVSPNTIPLASALVEVAQEHFGFHTAESGVCREKEIQKSALQLWSQPLADSKKVCSYF